MSKNKNDTLPNKIASYIRGNPKRMLMWILCAAFFIRFAFILILQPNGYYFSDTRYYDSAAQHILAGEGFDENYNRSPLYPVFMAGVYAVFGHSFTAMRTVEALLSILLIWLIFQIAKKAFGDTAAWLSAILAAVFPHFILLTGILYSTNLFTVLLALSIYSLILADEKTSYVWLAGSSLFAALAALTFPAFFFILPFWLVWMLIRRKSSMLQNVSTALFFGMVFIAALTPWTVRNYHKYNRFTLVRPVPHTAFPNLENLEAQKERINSGFKDTSDYLKKNPTGTKEDKISAILSTYLKHPGRSLEYMAGELTHFWALYPDRLDSKSEKYLKNIRAEDSRMVKLKSTLWKIVMMISVMVMLPVFLFAVIGLFSSRSFERNRLVLVLTIAALAIGYSLIYAEVRYRIPIEPYVLMFMAMGLLKVYHLYHAMGAKTAAARNSLQLQTPSPSVQVSYRQTVASSESCE